MKIFFHIILNLISLLFQGQIKNHLLQVYFHIEINIVSPLIPCITVSMIGVSLLLLSVASVFSQVRIHCCLSTLIYKSIN